MAKEKHHHQHPHKDTQALLKCGVAAGPLYVLIGLFEIVTRPGFSVFKHSLSLMSIGPQGWIHILLFIITGLLVILGAVGIRRAIKGEKAGTWGPILLGIYGASLIFAGLFVPDPMRGFPPGMTYGTISTGGILHLIAGMIGFTGLIAACFVFARRFRSQKKKGLATFSMLTGFVFLFSFIGIAGFSGSSDDGVVMFVTLAFYFAVLLSWIWLSTICARLLK
jgi:hypothetical membrane protein